MRTVILFILCLGFLLMRGHDHACAHQTPKNDGHLQFGAETEKHVPAVKKSALNLSDSKNFAIESEDEDFFIWLRNIPSVIAFIACCSFVCLSIGLNSKSLLAVAKPMYGASTPKYIQQRVIRL